MLEGHDHMSKVTDVEVSAFSECFLFSIFFFSNLLLHLLHVLISAQSYIMLSCNGWLNMWFPFVVLVLFCSFIKENMNTLFFNSNGVNKSAKYWVELKRRDYRQVKKPLFLFIEWLVVRSCGICVIYISNVINLLSWSYPKCWMYTSTYFVEVI